MRCCRSQRPKMENRRSGQFEKPSGRGLSKETSMEAWNFGLIEITLEPGHGGGERSGKDHGTNAWILIARESGKPVTCADLGGLKMPVLLLQGEKTPRRYASIVDATHKCLPSAERATIPEAGHAMHAMNPAA